MRRVDFRRVRGPRREVCFEPPELPVRATAVPAGRVLAEVSASDRTGTLATPSITMLTYQTYRHSLTLLATLAFFVACGGADSLTPNPPSSAKDNVTAGAAEAGPRREAAEDNDGTDQRDEVSIEVEREEVALEEPRERDPNQPPNDFPIIVIIDDDGGLPAPTAVEGYFEHAGSRYEGAYLLCDFDDNGSTIDLIALSPAAAALQLRFDGRPSLGTHSLSGASRAPAALDILVSLDQQRPSLWRATGGEVVLEATVDGRHRVHGALIPAQQLDLTATPSGESRQVAFDLVCL
jgi:hypothetical protein